MPVASAALSLAKGEFRLEPVKRTIMRRSRNLVGLPARPGYAAEEHQSRDVSGRRAAGEVPVSMFVPLSHLDWPVRRARPRCGRRENHEQFFTIWKDADPPLALLHDARWYASYADTSDVLGHKIPPVTRCAPCERCRAKSEPLPRSRIIRSRFTDRNGSRSVRRVGSIWHP